MTILFDINHPAHVHYFRNVIKKLEDKGHEVVLVSRNKEIEHDLLDQYDINYISRGSGADSIPGKFFYHLYAVFLLIKTILKFKVDVVVSFMHPYGVHAAYLTGRRSIVFTDTENAELHHRLTVPFATEIYSSTNFRLDFGKKHIRFKGFMELAYLHPSFFRPKRDVIRSLGLEEDEKFIFVRFVSRKSLQDLGHNGLTSEDKILLVIKLLEKCRVFISSEVPIPEELERFKINILEKDIHNVLYYASLFVGESATMATESSILGTPAIYLDDEGRGYTDILESNYKILNRFSEGRKGVLKAIEKAEKILLDENNHLVKRNRILEESIDLTAYLQSIILK